MDIARRYVRSLYSRFARTLVPSAALGAVLEDWGGGQTLPPWISESTRLSSSPPICRRISSRSELRLPLGTTLLLYVGRLSPEKNTQNAFRCFSPLVPSATRSLSPSSGGRRPAATAGPFVEKEDRCRDLAAVLQRPVPSWRACTGQQTFSSIPGVQETFGLVTLESQACGTPVVGIRGSYMDRIVFSDLGHWAAENNAGSLASAIERMSPARPPRHRSTEQRHRS